MPPETIRTLPPVIIQRVIEGPNPWLAFVGTLLLAGAGIAVGLWTLRKVYEQITIANAQLKIAGDELTAVRDDFALSQEQFALSQRQFAMVMRAPDIKVEVIIANEVRHTVRGGNIPYREVNFTAFVRNNGTKVAKGLTADVYIPEEVMFKHEQWLGPARTSQIGSKKYRLWHLPFISGQRVYLSRPLDTAAGFSFKPEIRDVELLWRADDE
ncbi:MAG TPA: hypothetical protein VIX83_04085 [Candidatus Cybelea sp.]